MCGINGIFGSLSPEDGVARLTKMNSALAHRGPDAEGSFHNKNIHLGHRRLSIIDISPASNQPMTDPSGRYTLVFNGEIYNFKELKKSLSDYTFTSHGDTEVLLAGLINQGVDFLKKCNGMFALALWDNQKEELLLARDRIGIKPLYYARTSDHFIFSSEVRSILKSGFVNGELNYHAIGDYLRYQTSLGANTMLKGVYMLQPGSVMHVAVNEAKIEYFWSPVVDYDREMIGLSYENTKTRIRQKLDAAVNRRLIADVPMGAFLSGGIDSSALVALASQQVDKLKTFTITFEDPEFSEAKYARIVAKKYNTDHTDIQLTPNSLLDVLPSAIVAMDHPSGDGINTYLVSKYAKQAGITVALSGLGGDELFAGYPIFKQFYELGNKGWMMSFPKFARAFAGDILKIAKPGVWSEKTKQVITEDYLDLENIYQYSRELNSRKTISKLSPYGNSGGNSVFETVKEGVGFGTPGYNLPKLSRVTFAELIGYVEPTLLRDSDQMSMAHALEIRVPFLDHELVSAVMAVSDNHKYPSSPKKLLVESMGDLLPSEIVNRPKMGFSFPWDAWMRNELKDFCGDHLTNLGTHDAFNGDFISKRWNAFLKKDPKVSWMRIWPMVILSAWMSENGIK